jgi:hypothetical protein
MQSPNFIFFIIFLYSLIKIVHFCLFTNNYSFTLKQKIWTGWVENNLNMRNSESAAAAWITNKMRPRTLHSTIKSFLSYVSRHQIVYFMLRPYISFSIFVKDNILRVGELFKNKI